MIFLALKHLLARKKQSVVTLLGILIGTTAFIVISSFFLGFQEYLTDTLVSGDAHIKVQAREREIKQDDIEKVLFPEEHHFLWRRKPAGRRSAPNVDNPLGWYERFASQPGFIAATPIFTTTALINDNQITYPLNLTGMRPASMVKVTNIETKMISGSILDLGLGTARIVIGSELADSLAKQVGDMILLTSNDGKQHPFKVVGIFSTGNQYADRTTAYTNLSDAQNLGNAAGRISQISIKISDFRQAADLASSWKRTSYDKVQSWDQSNENLLSIFKTQDIMRFATSGIIILVAAFGIYNILNMVVNQKRKDIAILRSMGYEARDIINLFLLQGITLGVIGGLLGCVIGYFIGRAIGNIDIRPPGARGASGGFEITFRLSVYLLGLLISNSAALAASFFPAYSASKLTPIEIIRGAD